MNAPAPAGEPADISAWISALASDDPVARDCARSSLVKIGSREVAAALIPELSDPRTHVRWEAAKVLSAIGDPISAPALLHALDDEDEDVRWVAAEGLAALGRTGLISVLHGLTKQARSLPFCQSAHHVLHSFAQQGFQETVQPVITALQHQEPAIAAPPTAFKALMSLKVWG